MVLEDGCGEGNCGAEPSDLGLVCRIRVKIDEELTSGNTIRRCEKVARTRRKLTGYGD